MKNSLTLSPKHMDNQGVCGLTLRRAACCSGTDVLLDGLNLRGTPLYAGRNALGEKQLHEWIAGAREFVRGGNADKPISTPSSAPQIIMCGDFNIEPTSDEYVCCLPDRLNVKPETP